MHKGFQWWFRFISSIWIYFLFPFSPLCRSKIITTNKGFYPMFFSYFNISVLWNPYICVKWYEQSRKYLQSSFACCTNHHTFLLLFNWLKAWLHSSLDNYSEHGKEAEILPEKPFKDAKLIHVFFRNVKVEVPFRQLLIHRLLAQNATVAVLKPL